MKSSKPAPPEPTMKAMLPTHPHTATTQIHHHTAGGYFARIAVEISVPSRVAAMLPEHAGRHYIQSANVVSLSDVRPRALNWKGGRTRGGKRILPLVTHLEQATAEGCNTSIKIEIPPDEWHLVGILCGKLGITPGQWFVACATYNAAVEESAIEAQLASIARIEIEESAK